MVAGVWATPQQVTGRAYVDALVAAGFDKGAMQLTPDESTVGNPAESIQFSVRWGEECLVGQVGPATGEPVAIVVPVLAEGTCLVGQIRPPDANDSVNRSRPSMMVEPTWIASAAVDEHGATRATYR